MQLFEHAKHRASNDVDVHHNVPIFFADSESPLTAHNTTLIDINSKQELINSPQFKRSTVDLEIFAIKNLLPVA